MRLSLDKCGCKITPFYTISQGISVSILGVNYDFQQKKIKQIVKKIKGH